MADRFTTKDMPYWLEMLLMVAGELAFAVVAVPLYIVFVLPRHPEGVLPGFVPPIAEGVNPFLAILAAITTCAAGVGLVILLVKTLGYKHFSLPDIEEYIKSLRTSDMLLLYIAAGIGEEMMYRVVLQDLFGLVIAAILFTATHVAYWKRPVVLFDVFVLALLLGALYMYTQSFWLCAATHAIYNFIMTILYKKRVIPLDDMP